MTPEDFRAPGPATPGFDPSLYWRGRVGADAGLDVVGHRTQGVAFNRWLYRRRSDVLHQALRAHAAAGRGLETWSVCELGFGSGHWLSWWQERGVARLSGADVSARAVASARSRFPGVALVEADLAAPAAPALPLADGAADVVTLFDVLYHVTDDAAATRLLGRAARLLRPDGRLWLFENPLPRTLQLRSHVRFRSRARLLEMLRAAGLALEAEYPLFLALHPPGTGRRAVDLAIAGAYALAGRVWQAFPALGERAGRLAYRADGAWLGPDNPWALRLASHRLWVLRPAG